MDRSLYTVAGPRGFSLPSPTSLFSALPCLDRPAPVHEFSCHPMYTTHSTNILPHLWTYYETSKERGRALSYRDYIEAQKKYIQTKKEALAAKRERERSPRPPSYDPPPARTHPLLIAGLLLLAVLPLFILPFLLVPAAVSQPPAELTLWVCSSAAEFAALQNWLEPELLANELTWTLRHTDSKEELLFAWRQRLVDLAIVGEDLAEELYASAALAPLWDRLEGPQGTASPPLGREPFGRPMAGAIPSVGKSLQRATWLVMRQFAPAFSLSCRSTVP